MFSYMFFESERKWKRERERVGEQYGNYYIGI